MLLDYKIDNFESWYHVRMGSLGVMYDKLEGSLIDTTTLPYDAYEDRPEYQVGRTIFYLEEHSLDELAEIYLTLLEGIMLIKTTESCKTLDEAKAKLASKNDQLLARMKYTADWLRSTDFFYAPASSQYHDAEPGGLLKHSLRVYNNILELMKVDKFNKVDVASAALVALVHDWCKIDMYEVYQKNVKDETTGQWHKEDAYRTNQKGVPLGHGVASMFLAQKLFSLTTEECLAIRWHMGAWRVCDQEMNEMQKSNEKFPLVHLLQFADQLSIVDY